METHMGSCEDQVRRYPSHQRTQHRSYKLFQNLNFSVGMAGGPHVWGEYPHRGPFTSKCRPGSDLHLPSSLTRLGGPSGDGGHWEEGWGGWKLIKIHAVPMTI